MFQTSLIRISVKFSHLPPVLVPYAVALLFAPDNLILLKYLMLFISRVYHWTFKPVSFGKKRFSTGFAALR